MYFEQKASPAEIIAAGHDANSSTSLLNKVEHPANEFKRRQLPPTLIISQNAIGVGRRRARNPQISSNPANLKIFASRTRPSRSSGISIC